MCQVDVIFYNFQNSNFFQQKMMIMIFRHDANARLIVFKLFFVIHAKPWKNFAAKAIEGYQATLI